jgi:hypothetical protein
MILMRMIIGYCCSLLLIGALAAPSWLVPTSAAELQISSPPHNKGVSAVLPKRKSMPTRRAEIVSVEPLTTSERVLARFPIVLGIAY